MYSNNKIYLIVKDNILSHKSFYYGVHRYKQNWTEELERARIYTTIKAAKNSAKHIKLLENERLYISYIPLYESSECYECFL